MDINMATAISVASTEAKSKAKKPTKIKVEPTATVEFEAIPVKAGDNVRIKQETNDTTATQRHLARPIIRSRSLRADALYHQGASLVVIWNAYKAQVCPDWDDGLPPTPEYRTHSPSKESAPPEDLQDPRPKKRVRFVTPSSIASNEDHKRVGIKCDDARYQSTHAEAEETTECTEAGEEMAGCMETGEETTACTETKKETNTEETIECKEAREETTEHKEVGEETTERKDVREQTAEKQTTEHNEAGEQTKRGILKCVKEEGIEEEPLSPESQLEREQTNIGLLYLSSVLGRTTQHLAALNQAISLSMADTTLDPETTKPALKALPPLSSSPTPSLSLTPTLSPSPSLSISPELYYL